MRLRPTALTVSALLAAVDIACAPEARTVHRPASFVWCGTTLYRAVEGRVPWRLHPVSGDRSADAPSRSVLPAAAASPPPGGLLEMVLTGDCDTAPMVTVRPVDAARTLVIASGTNGGIAGLTLVTFGKTITIRAYRDDRLVGELTLLQGAAPIVTPTTTP
jgi:hypothetical protein